MNLAALLTRAAAARPESAAVALGGSQVASYRDLAGAAASLAGWLRDRQGSAAGDRVALVMKNCPAYLEVLFAVWHAGLCAVPVNAKLHAKELAYIFDHARVSSVFFTEDLAQSVAEAVAELGHRPALIAVNSADYRAARAAEAIEIARTQADDPAWLFYTSGTTGQPKGAVLSHANLMMAAHAYLADVDPVEASDCILHAAPMSHGSGIYIVPHMLRGALQVIPESGRFDPPEVLRLIEHHPGLGMFAAPTMVKRLVDHPATASADTRNLKLIVYGGGPMYVADCKRALAVLGDKLAQIYGQGESPMTITTLSRALHADRNHPNYEARLGSAGLPYAMVDVEVRDPDGRTLPPGEVGEVCVRGPTVMRGYLNNEEGTARALRDGWLHTGDMASFDADGFLTLKDRSKDLIISGGSNIYPREVEEVLLRHPDVAEVSVIGVPDRDWGEVVVAYVVPFENSAPSPQSLDAYCLDNIARFKRPKDYRFVDSLPKNNYGKVLKTELRKLAAASAGT